MDASKAIVTAYGTVEAVALRELQGQFPTAELLDASVAELADTIRLVERLGRLRPRDR